MKEDTTRERSEWTRPREPSKSKEAAKESRQYLKLGKRLKAIYKDEGLDFGTDLPDEETLIDRFRVATRLRKGRIEDVFRNIRRARNVQLCFLVDCIGSMQPHIDGVRQSIFEIVRKLTAEGRQVADALAKSLTLAFFAYRDHNDEAKHFGVMPFTNADQFKTLCTRLTAIGGPSGAFHDLCELETATNLNWSESCGTKVMFHICDYPCHGKEFHNGVDDGQPDGDPKGRTPQELFRKIRGKGIQYHFGKITSYTDIMIQKFSVAYGDVIIEFDVKNVKDIEDSVVNAVTQSVDSSISSSKITVGAARVERTFTMDKTEPDWSTLRETKGRFFSYLLPKSIKDIKDDEPLERKKLKEAIVKLAKSPFGRGAERLAYYGKDVSTYDANSGNKSDTKTPPATRERDIRKKNEEIVLKEYLHTGKGMNSAKRYELSNQLQTIAAFLAQEFMKDVKKKDSTFKHIIKFIKIRTLVLNELAPYRYMSCEKRLSAGDKFVRFTNNADYHINVAKAMSYGVSMEYVELVTAFSHWTYKATNRFLMVVDLEGVVPQSIGSEGSKGVLLTDPAIHCTDLTRYGKLNHGPGGMKKFFDHHVCNQFCKKLGLEGFVSNMSV
ncbi:hypothetical protein PMAYCL1PPCAC_14176 [Pristionchus mayeri]|uniref:Alpha-type protein kinase domain-containing protein n=1 Tax=Pristionchus mayeri TaxID=1317129 RepID=A0AAN4ZNI9_9BILA|nr:hypothetical protein PMAYCL1PPCAC_14176 [Pristionchus mayeri]